jgi:polysaccharide export outer membrane protein
MIARYALALMVVTALGCSALSHNKVVSPAAPAGMETIDIPAAQQDDGSSQLSTLPPDDSESLNKLVPGDVITIQVYDQPLLSMEVRITRTGEITYPIIGRLKLLDRTVEEIETDIKKGLEEHFLKSAQVTVLVKEHRKRSVFVLGNVNKPGSYDIIFGKSLTLLQAVSLAGGFSADADKEKMLLIRENAAGERSSYRIAYSDIVERGNIDNDVKLRDGDILIVEERGKVYVLGRVQSPGGYTVPAGEKMTLTKIISLAGGFDALAAQSRTTIMRSLPEGKIRILRINVGEVFNGSLCDPVMLPGDIVFVPESLF